VGKTFTYAVNEGEIKLSGYIDRFTVNDLVNNIKIDKICNELLVLDLAEVTRVDTAGLAWILKVRAQASHSGQTVKLNEIPTQLLNLAKISGVEQLLVSS
jgi:phospholipid transport system transporter-binding protein